MIYLNIPGSVYEKSEVDKLKEVLTNAGYDLSETVFESNPLGMFLDLEAELRCTELYEIQNKVGVTEEQVEEIINKVANDYFDNDNLFDYEYLDSVVFRAFKEVIGKEYNEVSNEDVVGYIL